MLIKTSNQLIDEAKARIQEISVHELANEIGNNHIILIDVREPDEYAAGHVDRAINYPRGVLEMRIHQHPEVIAHCDTEAALAELAQQPIYLICRSGGRSALAADALQAMGLQNVYSVAGGFTAWAEASLPTTR